MSLVIGSTDMWAIIVRLFQSARLWEDRDKLSQLNVDWKMCKVDSKACFTYQQSSLQWQESDKQSPIDVGHSWISSVAWWSSSYFVLRFAQYDWSSWLMNRRSSRRKFPAINAWEHRWRRMAFVGQQKRSDGRIKYPSESDSSTLGWWIWPRAWHWNGQRCRQQRN